MKVGDIVCCKANGAWSKGGEAGVIVSELRHGVNSSFVDVLVDGKVIPVNFKALKVLKLEVISESG